MTPPTVLIADDDRSIRTVLTQALGRSGYQVRSTGNAATLWRWVEDGEGDLVITDVVMPDENGLDLIPRIKRIRPDMRVIVMSAQSTLMTAVKAAQRGAFEYLPKPFDLQELIAVVGRALSVPTEHIVTPPEARDSEETAAADRPQPLDAGDLPDHRPPDDRGPDRDDQRRVRHRQGTGGARAARLRQAARRSVRRRQHGGDPARIDRERVVRPRARRLHRCHQPHAGALRAGQWRHPFPRRDRRHAARGANTAAARVAGRRVHLGRRAPTDQGQRSHHRRHPPRSAERDPAWPIP